MSMEIMTAATAAGIMGAGGITSGTVTDTNTIPTGAGNTGAPTIPIIMATVGMATDVATVMAMAATVALATMAPAGRTTRSARL